MNIFVTPHAIKQYKEKSREFDLQDEQAEKMLNMIATRGSVVCPRPGGDNIFEVKYNGLSIVVKKNPNETTVITFLGDSKYRQWCRKKEIQPRYSEMFAL